MSVNLLQKTSKPLQVSDELESFFHVLVYYSVRYLRSNCPDVPSWIDNYFNTYAAPNRLYPCGQKSTAVESTGYLQTGPAEGPLLFNSPMDELLATMLNSFRAYYKVLQDEVRRSAPPAPPCSRPRRPTRSPSPVPVVIPASWFVFRCIGDDDAPDAPQKPVNSSAASQSNGPTAEDRHLAKNVATHDFFLNFLTHMVCDQGWRGGDRISMPQGSAPAFPGRDVDTSTPARAALAADQPTSSKRQRTRGPEHNISLPARLHSTRRTRKMNQARTHPIHAK